MFRFWCICAFWVLLVVFQVPGSKNGLGKAHILNRKFPPATKFLCFVTICLGFQFASGSMQGVSQSLQRFYFGSHKRPAVVGLSEQKNMGGENSTRLGATRWSASTVAASPPSSCPRPRHSSLRVPSNVLHLQHSLIQSPKFFCCCCSGEGWERY